MAKPSSTLESPVVYPDHQQLTALLIHSAQDRPDLLPVSRSMISLAQRTARTLELDAQQVTGYVILHELGKYLHAPDPEPLRIAKCDLPSGVMISRGVELAGAQIAAQWPLPAPALIVALIAWCELHVAADGKLMTLHQRRLYMERHYGSDHPQYQRWQALRPLADRVADLVQ